MSIFDKAKDFATIAKNAANAVVADIKENKEEYIETAKKAGKATGSALMDIGNAVEKQLDKAVSSKKDGDKSTESTESTESTDKNNKA